MAAYYYRYFIRPADKATSDGKSEKGVFEMLVRKLPRNRSYLVAAGLEQVLYFLMNIRFNEEQLSYLESLEAFKDMGEDFFEYLRNFKFTGTIWAVPEGTILFPNEPLIRVEAPVIEAQIVETYLLSMMNFQSLIATKASRIVTADKRKVHYRVWFKACPWTTSSPLSSQSKLHSGLYRNFKCSCRIQVWNTHLWNNGALFCNEF